MSEERTEKATPRRRHKAREEGDGARSRDLQGAAAMLAGTLVIGLAGDRWSAQWASAYARLIAISFRPAEGVGEGLALMLLLRRAVLDTLLPVLLLGMAAVTGSAFAGLLQGGMRLNPVRLRPKLARVSPLASLKNLVSMQAAARLGKSLLPTALLAAMAATRLQHQLHYAPLSVSRLPAMLADSYHLLRAAAWIFFAWSGVDFLLEWRAFERRIRMSKQDLRDEFKQTEGNPQVRGRIRAIQRQMRRRKMQADVSRATVVITNPTHFAVALAFDFATMEPPRVLAKGRNLIAEQIKTDARWSGVPIVENPPLARSLYRAVETGQPIPMNLYAAVASILAYLYRQQVEEKLKRDRAARKVLPPVAPAPAAPLPGRRKETL